MPDAWEDRRAADATVARESPAMHRVGWGFISLYTLAYISTSLLFLAPLLVTLALKVNSLVGIERAPDSLALVAGTGAFLAMLGNPFFGKMSDRTSSRLGMRRPWMVIGLDKIGSAEADVPQQIFLGTLVQSVVVVAASLIGGRLSDRTGRRKMFVLTASIVYGVAMFVIAIASNFNGFLVGMAIGGLGFGVYVSVDLALVADVLPDKDSAAKDLGVFNIAGALPFPLRRRSRRTRSPRGKTGRARAGMGRFRRGTAQAVPRVKGCPRR